ncbi:1559_t:CDS:2 [Paraglomus occultum]|uniref:Small ribosomal subunit protein uS10m n=1 Tax=Paraglomus occultum TaxID=144539 RepID=A0A9N9EVE7_9GLOM|nr:1559_t:CDS:2 [Paraglomus occultum]
MLSRRYTSQSIDQSSTDFSSTRTPDSSSQLPPLSKDANSSSIDGKQTEEDVLYLKEPEQYLPTHNVVVCDLHFRSYVPSHMDFYVDFCRRAAGALRIPCSGPVPLPTKTTRWAVPRGPFIHKKTQENFERKTHKRLLQLKDANRDVIERWLYYIIDNAPSGIGMRVTLWEYEELDVGERMLKQARGEEKIALKAVENDKGEKGLTGEKVATVANVLVKEMERQVTEEEHEDTEKQD